MAEQRTGRTIAKTGGFQPHQATRSTSTTASALNICTIEPAASRPS
jgi:hypothetical protein